jgi:hypothetical protein
LTQVYPHLGAGGFRPQPQCRYASLLAQVCPVLGAGGVFGGGPAPQNGLLCTTVAQVPALFPHLRQHTPTPAPNDTSFPHREHASRTPGMPRFPTSSRSPQAIDNQGLPLNSPLSDHAGISRKLFRINDLDCEILVAMEESPNHDYSLSLHLDGQRRLSGNTIIL